MQVLQPHLPLIDQPGGILLWSKAAEQRGVRVRCFGVGGAAAARACSRVWWKARHLAGLWSLKRRRKKMSDRVRNVKQDHLSSAQVSSRRIRGTGGGGNAAARGSSSAAAASSSSMRHSCSSLTASHTAQMPTTVTHCSLQNTPTQTHSQAANTRAQPGRGAAATGKKSSRAKRKKIADAGSAN